MARGSTSDARRELCIGIGSDRATETVRIEFGVPTQWIAMRPETAEDFRREDHEGGRGGPAMTTTATIAIEARVSGDGVVYGAFARGHHESACFWAALRAALSDPGSPVRWEHVSGDLAGLTHVTCFWKDYGGVLLFCASNVYGAFPVTAVRW